MSAPSKCTLISKVANGLKKTETAMSPPSAGHTATSTSKPLKIVMYRMIK